MTRQLCTVIVGLLVALVASACTYGGAAAVDEDTVVITKTSLFGLITNVHVCQVTDQGLTDCSQRDTP